MKIESLLKDEIKNLFTRAAESELYAHSLYQHLANECQRIGLFGAQKYFLKESEDELSHYRKLADFVNDMGDTLLVPPISAITDDVKTISDAIELAYEAELALMKQYSLFYDEAEDKYEDCVTATFLIDFLQIQRKSVGEYLDLAARLNLGGDIYAFDKYMGKLAEK